MSNNDLIWIAKAVSNSPEQKHIQLINDDLCISFSTILPPKAALIPKKNIANEKANCTDDYVAFI